jgi:hypothetical protein
MAAPVSVFWRAAEPTVLFQTREAAKLTGASGVSSADTVGIRGSPTDKSIIAARMRERYRFMDGVLLFLLG